MALLQENYAETIDKIADRAVALYSSYGIKANRRDIILDIVCCHHHACRLRLDELLVADNVNFMHDIAGINRHLNRRTFKLEDCFLPRFAV